MTASAFHILCRVDFLASTICAVLHILQVSFEKKQTQKGSAIYNAIFDILILNEARDWYTSELPEYENLDDHHIIPQSWGKKNVGNDINSILNKTPLSAATNRYIISDRMPFDYLKEMKETAVQRLTNMCNLLQKILFEFVP